MQPLSDEALDTIFRQARTHNGWLDKPVSDDLLHQIYDLAKFGPTSANTSPMRIAFVKSAAAKQRLKPALMPANADKTMAAPVCAPSSQMISGFMNTFPSSCSPLTRQFAEMFTQPGNEEFTQTHIMRNATLRGAYLIIAARAMGLDCGPMSGFDNGKVDAEFFPDGRWKSNFLINLGYGDASKLSARARGRAWISMRLAGFYETIDFLEKRKLHFR